MLSLLIHSIADRPWNRLGADIFNLNSKHHIFLIDYYSDYIEVNPGMNDTISTAESLRSLLVPGS